MLFCEMSIPGAFIVEPERKQDTRGFFARSWCRQEFEEHGLSARLAQCNISFNRKRGTLRGMHYQTAPHEEAKLVRCTMGAVYDVVLDLRPASPTWGCWVAVELTARNRKQLYIPEGVAHGFQTLKNNTEMSYQMSEPYYSDLARGVRWDDPVFAIDWPLADPIVSERDRAFALIEQLQVHHTA